MSQIDTPSPTLHDLPLWRLLVALADAERAFGPTNPVTRRIADALRKRLAEADQRAPGGSTDG
jgi:hypothetical protein